MGLRTAFVVLLAAAVFALPSFAATRYRQGAVMRAFSHVGIKLVDQAPGEALPVIQLGDTAHRHRPWSIAVYLYPSERQAAAVYAGSAKRWRASGFAVLRLTNMIVAVVPTGRTLAKKAPPFPMPAVVKSAIAALR
jgi:hypothetical protein